MIMKLLAIGPNSHLQRTLIFVALALGQVNQDTFRNYAHQVPS